jgi:phosphoglucomutase/phosphomannomutase
MNYFEIEPRILELQNISDGNRRRRELDDLLKFLGSNPVEKVDAAFRAKFGEGILEMLGLGG